MIRHKVSKIFKLVDSVSNYVVDDAQIRLQGGGLFQNKGDGFYVIDNLPDGQYLAEITREGYNRLVISFEVQRTVEEEIELILMEVASKTTALGTQTIIQGVLKEGKVLCKDQTFTYSIVSNTYTKRVLSHGKKGDKELKLQYSVKEPLDYRKIAIDEVKGEYTLLGYDFATNTYKLKEALEEEVEIGAMIYLLNKLTTDAEGKYRIIVDSRAANKEGIIKLLFFYKGKEKKLEMNISEITKQDLVF